MIENYQELAAGALSGTAMTALLARMFISKTLKALDNAVDSISVMSTQLATISVKLENLGKTYDLIHDIDRKVVALETRINARDYSQKR